MTTDALEQARTAFLQGTAAFAERRFDDAAQAFAHALAMAPGRPSVMLNLGVTRLHQGQRRQPCPCWRPPPPHCPMPATPGGHWRWPTTSWRAGPTRHAATRAR